jgi:hypothetical protein
MSTNSAALRRRMRPTSASCLRPAQVAGPAFLERFFGRCSFFKPYKYFIQRDDLFIRPFDGGHLVISLRQGPGFLQSLVLGRPFARQHIVLQRVVDLSNMASHFSVSFVATVGRKNTRVWLELEKRRFDGDERISLALPAACAAEAAFVEGAPVFPHRSCSARPIRAFPT